MLEMDKIICVFGDSVTYAGYVEKGWVTLLKEHLESSDKDYFELYNLGICGETTTGLVKRIKVELQARTPIEVIIAIGVNDSAFWGTFSKPVTDKQTFKNNLLAIINMVKKYTNKITFIGLVLGNDRLLNPFNGSSTEKCWQRKVTQEYDALIEEVAKKHGCSYVKLFDQLEFADFSDGLHPNQQGHQKMSKAIISRFKRGS